MILFPELWKKLNSIDEATIQRTDEKNLDKIDRHNLYYAIGAIVVVAIIVTVISLTGGFAGLVIGSKGIGGLAILGTALTSIATCWNAPKHMNKAITVLEHPFRNLFKAIYKTPEGHSSPNIELTTSEHIVNNDGDNNRSTSEQQNVSIQNHSIYSSEKDTFLQEYLNRDIDNPLIKEEQRSI